MLAPAGARVLFVAGQIPWNVRREIVGRGDIAAQFRQALENVVAVVAAAGGAPRDLASMTIFVTDKARYVEARKAIGAAWVEVMGKHYPAVALVEVKGLLEPEALVEIQAVAAIAEGGKKRIVDALRASLEKGSSTTPEKPK
jgi:enamine deaminase RidA (YjgF/YER057c/UK114 family)